MAEEKKKALVPADAPFTGQPVGHDRWTEAHFKSLIEYAWGFKMSDIKLIPDFPPFIRVYGKWHAVNDTPITAGDIDLIIGAISGSDSLPARVRGGDFADFAYEVRAGRAARRRFRCNASGMVMPGGLTGVSLVLRTIPESIPTLADASLVEGNRISPILKNMFPAQGIVLFTGPTGSGKTTTLAAGIGYLLRVHPELSVETYEDPVEFDYRTARGTGPLIQMSVTDHLRGDFQKIAPNAARRSSDVVIVGETRDKASFRGLIQLADMGMLTISTLHTRSVAETPSRILNTFSADEQPEIKASLIHGLRFIVQQRLLPTVDGRRVAVREFLALSERIRYELSRQRTEEMIPFLRQMTAKHGQLLINDVYAKYKAGIIDAPTFKRMEAENEEAMRIGQSGDAPVEKFELNAGMPPTLPEKEKVSNEKKYAQKPSENLSQTLFSEDELTSVSAEELEQGWSEV